MNGSRGISDVLISEEESGVSDSSEESDSETSDEEDAISEDAMSEGEMMSEDDEPIPIRKRRHIQIQSDESDEDLGNNEIGKEDESAEGCPVCLSSFIGQDLGTPENCNHIFCLECIMEWSRNINTCPIDRNEFNYVLLKSKANGNVLKRIRVKVVPKEPEASLQEESTLCEVCHRGDQEDHLLLCDACDLAYHCECLDPPLFHIPIDEWFCPPCSGILKNGAVGDANLHRSRRVIPRTRASETVRTRVQNRRSATVTSRSISVVRGRKRKRRSYRRNFKKIVNLARTKKSISGAGKGEMSDRATRVIVTYRRSHRKKRKKSTKSFKRGTQDKRKQSSKGRLVKCLGLVSPQFGTAVPDVRPKTESTKGPVKQPSHSLFGVRDQLMDFSEDFNEAGPSTSSSIYRSRVKKADTSNPSSVDLLDSILAGQKVLHTMSKGVVIKSDGSLVLKESEKRESESNKTGDNSNSSPVCSDKIGTIPIQKSEKLNSNAEVYWKAFKGVKQNGNLSNQESVQMTILKSHLLSSNSKNSSDKYSNEIKNGDCHANSKTYKSKKDKRMTKVNTSEYFSSQTHKIKSESIEYSDAHFTDLDISESLISPKNIAASLEDNLICNLRIKVEVDPDVLNDPKVDNCKKEVEDTLCLEYSQNSKKITLPSEAFRSFQSEKNKIVLQNDKNKPEKFHHTTSLSEAFQYLKTNNSHTQSNKINNIKTEMIKKEPLSSDEEFCPKRKFKIAKNESSYPKEKSKSQKPKDCSILNMEKLSGCPQLKPSSSSIPGSPVPSHYLSVNNTVSRQFSLAKLDEILCTQLAIQSKDSQALSSHATRHFHNNASCTQLADFDSLQLHEDGLPCTQMAALSNASVVGLSCTQHIHSNSESFLDSQCTDLLATRLPDLPSMQLRQASEEDLCSTKKIYLNSAQITKPFDQNISRLHSKFINNSMLTQYLSSNLKPFCASSVEDLSSTQLLNPKDCLAHPCLTNKDFVCAPEEDLPPTQVLVMSPTQSAKPELVQPSPTNKSYILDPEVDLPSTQLISLSPTQFAKPSLVCSRSANQSYVLAPEDDFPPTQLLGMSPIQSVKPKLVQPCPTNKCYILDPEDDLSPTQPVSVPFKPENDLVDSLSGNKSFIHLQEDDLPSTQITQPLFALKTKESKSKPAITRSPFETLHPTQPDSLFLLGDDSELPATQAAIVQQVDNPGYNQSFQEAKNDDYAMNDLPPTQPVNDNEIDLPERVKEALHQHCLQVVPARQIGVHKHLPQVITSVPMRSMPSAKPTNRKTFSFEQVKKRFGLDQNKSESEMSETEKWKLNKTSYESDIGSSQDISLVSNACHILIETQLNQFKNVVFLQNDALNTSELGNNQLEISSKSLKSYFQGIKEDKDVKIDVSKELPIEMQDAKDVFRFSPIVKEELASEHLEISSNDDNIFKNLDLTVIKQEPILSGDENKQNTIPKKRILPKPQTVKKEASPSINTCDIILKENLHKLKNSSKINKKDNCQKSTWMKKKVFKAENKSTKKDFGEDLRGKVSCSKNHIQKESTAQVIDDNICRMEGKYQKDNKSFKPQHVPAQIEKKKTSDLECWAKKEKSDIKLEQFSEFVEKKRKLASKDSGKSISLKENTKGQRERSNPTKIDTTTSKRDHKLSVKKRKDIRSELKCSSPLRESQRGRKGAPHGNENPCKGISPKQHSNSLTKCNDKKSVHKKAVKLENCSKKQSAKHDTGKTSKSVNKGLNIKDSVPPNENTGNENSFSSIPRQVKEERGHFSPNESQTEHGSNAFIHPYDHLQNNSRLKWISENEESSLSLFSDACSNEESFLSASQCRKALDTLHRVADEIISSSNGVKNEFKTGFVEFAKIRKNPRSKEYKVNNSRDLKEEIATEVKIVLKPFYTLGVINKEDYKDIMRKAVPKIFLNCGKTVQPDKIKKLILNYISSLKHS